MGAFAKISTQSITETIGNLIKIKIFSDEVYVDGCEEAPEWQSLPAVLSAMIGQDTGTTINNQSYNEGELVFIYRSNETYFSLNNEGELVVHGLNSDNYYIDENGNLIYDFCQGCCEGVVLECDTVACDVVE